MKDIKDYLHLYLGCKFVLRIRETNEISGEMNFTVDALAAALTNKKEDTIVPLLLLRPLSDMTEEECTDVYTTERDRLLHDQTQDYDIRRANGCWKIVRLDLIDTTLFITDNAIVYKVTEDNGKPMIEYTRNLPDIFHYLLSKHFDLFDLIPSGLAIDSTKVK